MNDKVVIAGHVKLKNTIKAKTNLHNVINGTPSWVVNTGGGGIVYPHYTGSYTVTPSGSVQVLDTSDKIMDNDVTVQAVPQGSATTPATIITANPSISVSSGGLITATVSKTQQVTPTVQEGYVSAGTAGNVGVSGSNTQQLTTQGAQTIHPASTDQSIASGKYLTGNQTFKAVTVTGLTANKVLQGTTVEIGDSDDSDRIMKVVGTASGGITPTGNINITQSGVTDVTDYATATVPSMTLGEVSLTPIGTQVDVINPSTTSTQYLNIPTGFHNSAQYYSIPAVALGTKSITENGTYNAYVDSVYGYSSVTVNVSGGGSGGGNATVTQDANGYIVVDDASPGGGGGSGIQIGIQNTSIPNILNMFYALENGTAKTGEFTPATALPNTSTALFDTELTTVHGLFIADESQATLNTGNTPENLLFAFATNPVEEDSTNNIFNFDYAVHRTNIRLYQYKMSANTLFVNRGKWVITNGVFYYTAPYNKNDNYSAFSSGHTYRWVAW